MPSILGNTGDRTARLGTMTACSNGIAPNAVMFGTWVLNGASAQPLSLVRD